MDLDFGRQQIRIWRVGYYKDDRADVPFITVDKASYPESNLDAVFSARPREAEHEINIKVEASQISFILDGVDVVSAPPRNRRPGGGGGGFSVGMTGSGRRQASNFTLNKLGSGGNYPAFPALCSVGFAAQAGSEVVYSHYRIYNAGQSEERKVLGPHTGPG